MRSGTSLQRGERAGCTGCHESRYDSPPPQAGALPLALRRAPSRLKPWYGPERDFNYLTEVQPVFDAHCVKCHDYGKEGVKALNLCGDLGMVFNTSYVEIRKRAPLRWYPDDPAKTLSPEACLESPRHPGGPRPPGAVGKELVKPVDDGPPEVLPPYAWGACRSRLVDVVRSGHHGVKLPPEALDRLITWIDLNTSYYGTYACNFPNNPYGRCPLTFAQIDRLAALTGAGVSVKSKGPVDGPDAGTGINFTRPEFSPCLAGLTNTLDPKRVEALALISEGRRMLYGTTRADMPDFVLRNPVDLGRAKRSEQRLEREACVRKALLDGSRQRDD
jgi:hypothetical protein